MSLMPEHLECLWQYAESQCKPRRSAQPARVVAQALGTIPRTIMDWKHKVLVSHLMPIAAARDTENGPMGLYVPGNGIEAREYLRQLDAVIKHTYALRWAFRKAWETYSTRGSVQEVQGDLFGGIACPPP